ncbi:F-box/WD repeat-containing protein 7 [Polyrhizophydium stewartii]|uniref:F-box/WD repeat-containing protein 7 n=1 Tax=Polyrhizophydium stewartii TaxID=2732419 RepID=A0ABR4NJ62_9FUNG
MADRVVDRLADALQESAALCAGTGASVILDEDGGGRDALCSATARPTAGTRRLPREIWLMAFGWLDPASVARASRVCRLWHALCSDQRIWRRLCLAAGVEERTLILDLSIDTRHERVDWRARFIAFYRRQRREISLCEILCNLPRASPLADMASVAANAQPRPRLDIGQRSNSFGMAVLHAASDSAPCQQCEREQQFWSAGAAASAATVAAVSSSLTAIRLPMRGSPASGSPPSSLASQMLSLRPNREGIAASASPLSASPLSASPHSAVSSPTIVRFMGGARSQRQHDAELFPSAAMPSGHPAQYGSLSIDTDGAAVASYLRTLGGSAGLARDAGGASASSAAGTIASVGTLPDIAVGQMPLEPARTTIAGSRSSFLMHTMQGGCQWAPHNHELTGSCHMAGERLLKVVGALRKQPPIPEKFLLRRVGGSALATADMPRKRLAREPAAELHGNKLQALESTTTRKKPSKPAREPRTKKYVRIDLDTASDAAGDAGADSALEDSDMDGDDVVVRGRAVRRSTRRPAAPRSTGARGTRKAMRGTNSRSSSDSSFSLGGAEVDGADVSVAESSESLFEELDRTLVQDDGSDPILSAVQGSANKTPHKVHDTRRELGSGGKRRSAREEAEHYGIDEHIRRVVAQTERAMNEVESECKAQSRSLLSRTTFPCDIPDAAALGERAASVCAKLETLGTFTDEMCAEIRSFCHALQSDGRRTEMALRKALVDAEVATKNAKRDFAAELRAALDSSRVVRAMAVLRGE